MNEAVDKGNQAYEFPPDRWCNAEVAIDMSDLPNLPPRPLPEKVRSQFRAERLRWAQKARQDPAFRAELERVGIHLTPEELQEPPASGDANAPT